MYTICPLHLGILFGKIYQYSCPVISQQNTCVPIQRTLLEKMQRPVTAGMQCQLVSYCKTLNMC